jgi:hypothetical protein
MAAVGPEGTASEEEALDTRVQFGRKVMSQYALIGGALGVLEGATRRAVFIS